MATTRLSTKALLVQRGYGQVEPNHLSAQATGQIYAQLPAAADIDILENGQFVKYDYVDGVVNFGSHDHETGEWMLVYNEVKVYHDYESDNDFAMKKSNYGALVYSPVGDVTSVANARNYSGVVIDSPYAPNSTTDPFKVEIRNSPKMMPTGTTMVPRVFKTNVGDIYTTNCVAETSLQVGDLLTPGADGYLAKAGAASAAMKWQVVKVYTLPDRQSAVKLMRIA